MIRKPVISLASILLLGWFHSSTLPAADQSLRIASASSFVPTLKKLVHRFEQQRGGKVQVVSGSSGVLLAQILAGAPFDVFLSADEARATALAHKAIASAPYARGVLVRIGKGEPVAIAHPKHAPYGIAARAVVGDASLVYGKNAAQVMHFVLGGAARSGYVALAQAKDQGLAYELVPLDAYPPIDQYAVLLNPGQQAREFWQFLATHEARQLIERDGYLRP